MPGAGPGSDFKSVVIPPDPLPPSHNSPTGTDRTRPALPTTPGGIRPPDRDSLYLYTSPKIPRRKTSAIGRSDQKYEV